MNEQQRAEYMAIVAAVMASEKSWYSSSAWIASRAMEVWVSANKAANEAKP